MFDSDDSEDLALKALSEVKKLRSSLKTFYADFSEVKDKVERLDTNVAKIMLDVSKMEGSLDAISHQSNVNLYNQNTTGTNVQTNQGENVTGSQKD